MIRLSHNHSSSFTFKPVNKSRPITHGKTLLVMVNKEYCFDDKVKNTVAGVIIGVGGSKVSKCVQIFVFILGSLS